MSNNSYESIKARINISRKAFYTLKCDENCFIVNKLSRNSKRISDTFISTIVNNSDLSKYPEQPLAYNTSAENIKFDYKPNKEADWILSSSSINYRGTYVSMLLEKYAQKAYFEREQVYFKKIIEEITNSMSRNNLLKIIYRNNTKIILPFDIRTDEWSSYNYLIGVDLTDAESKSEGKLVNLRISYISNCRQIEKITIAFECDLSNDDKNEIEEKISSRGVQFVSEEPIEIKIRFTEKGKDMYDHMVFMRPQISEMPSPDEPDIYTFKCTATQARFYFFKFGADVEIISPIDPLRIDFLEQYKAAYLLYENNSKNTYDDKDK